MKNLLVDLGKFKISGSYWNECINSIEKSLCPQQNIALLRPCEEKDFEVYRNTLDDKLLRIHENVQRICEEQLIRKENPSIVKAIGLHLMIIIGEQNKKSPWNTPKSVSIARNILTATCQLFDVTNIFEIFSDIHHDHLPTILFMLRPKLLKDTWKTYPASVTCFEWILNHVEASNLIKHMPSVLPTVLIIYDDFVPENRIIGLQCIHMILQHTSMYREFIANGYNDVLYDALEKLTRERDVKYITILYSCIAQILQNLEMNDECETNLEWTKRDDVIATLLDNMEFEEDSERRYAYMLSLSQLLTNIGCSKWCEHLIRILSEYCGHHTDFRTLRTTLQVAELALTIFSSRIPIPCTILYTAFLKLHFNLLKAPTFDEEISRCLERCIHILYQLTPIIGSSITRDNRLRAVMKNSLHITSHDDTKYCN